MYLFLKGRGRGKLLFNQTPVAKQKRCYHGNSVDKAIEEANGMIDVKLEARIKHCQFKYDALERKYEDGGEAFWKVGGKDEVGFL